MKPDLRVWPFMFGRFFSPVACSDSANCSALFPFIPPTLFASRLRREKKKSFARVVLPARVSALLFLIENMKERHERSRAERRRREKKERAAERRGSHSWCMMHEVAALHIIALRPGQQRVGAMWILLAKHNGPRGLRQARRTDEPQSSVGINRGISAQTVSEAHDSS